MAVCDIKRDVWFIIVRLYQKDGAGGLRTGGIIDID